MYYLVQKGEAKREILFERELSITFILPKIAITNLGVKESTSVTPTSLAPNPIGVFGW